MERQRWAQNNFCENQSQRTRTLQVRDIKHTEYGWTKNAADFKDTYERNTILCALSWGAASIAQYSLGRSNAKHKWMWWSGRPAKWMPIFVQYLVNLVAYFLTIVVLVDHQYFLYLPRYILSNVLILFRASSTLYMGSMTWKSHFFNQTHTNKCIRNPQPKVVKHRGMVWSVCRAKLFCRFAVADTQSKVSQFSRITNQITHKKRRTTAAALIHGSSILHLFYSNQWLAAHLFMYFR